MQMPASGGMPGGGVATSQSPPFTVPIRYMILGIVGFALFAVDLALQSLHLGSTGVLVPAGVALTHLLTLASLLAFVMGAVYQLSTVAFLIPVQAVPLVRWNFWLYAVSAAGLIPAMAYWWDTGLIVFGSLMTLSIYVYAVIILLSVAKTKVRGAMQDLVLSAHAYLILAVTAALLMILGFTQPALSAYTTELLLTHILFAVGGFFTFLVMGFSFKLLPMFTLSHGFATWRQKWTLTLMHVSLWTLVVSVWTHAGWLLVVGAIAGLAAFVSQGLDLRGIVQKRMRKQVEWPIRAVLSAAIAGAVGLLLVLLQTGVHLGLAGWQSMVTFYLLGWITLTVMGYAYKIVPFLVWSKRYSKQQADGRRLLISDLINLRRSRPVFIGFGVGLIVFTLGSALSSSPIVTVGGILLGLSILVFCVQIMKVIDPGRVGKELTDRD